MKNSKIDVNKLQELHAQGLSNRQIAKQLECGHGTVADNLKKIGLSGNNSRPPRLEIIDGKAICSKCGELKDENQYLYNRRGQKYEYRFTYCLACRRLQLNDYRNKNPNSYIASRYSQLIRRCKKKNVPFDITKEYLEEIYKKQDGKCFYTDQEMILKYGQGVSDNTLSIDRVNPNKGYMIGNIVLCILRANTVKFNLNLHEVEMWLPGWYERLVKSDYVKF